MYRPKIFAFTTACARLLFTRRKVKRVFGLVITICGLFFVQCSFADWLVIATKVKDKRALLQADVRADQGEVIVAIICIPEPTMVVQWTGNMGGISISIDTVRLDVPKQITLANGDRALSLKPGHIRALIKGLNLQLKSTLLSGESLKAETSLVGFGRQFEMANLGCAL